MQKKYIKSMKGKSRRQRFLSTSSIIFILLIISGLASAPLSLLSDRTNIDDVLQMYAVQKEYSVAYIWLSRSLNGVIVVLLILLSRKIIAGSTLVTVGVRNIALALSIFLIFNYGLGSLFGLYAGLPNLFILLSSFSLIIFPLIQGPSPQRLINIYRYVASFMLIGSLLMGFFFPDVSYMADPSYSFTSGGISRLIGLFDNPSILGLYALILFAIELRSGVTGRLHIVNIILCPVILVLSVSKTSIALAIILLLWHLSSKGKLRALIVIFILVATFGYVLLLNPIAISYFNASENILTLTGRTVLWESILDAWVNNPLFGNGPVFFSTSGKTQFLHAHNIILQSISDAGFFGLIGLIGYLFALISTALKNKVVSRSLSVLLVLLLFAFSMIDAVMRVDSFVTGVFFINAFILLYLCALDRQRNAILKNYLVDCGASSLVEL